MFKNNMLNNTTGDHSHQTKQDKIVIIKNKGYIWRQCLII